MEQSINLRNGAEVAQRTIIVDDITDQEVAEGDARVLTIGLDGQWYELDVASETEARVREYVQECVDAGRKVDAPKPPKPARKKKDYDVPTVRRWAKEQGLEVSVRGQISDEIVAAWKAGHSAEPEAAAAAAPPAKATPVAAPARKAEGAPVVSEAWSDPDLVSAANTDDGGRAAVLS